MYKYGYHQIKVVKPDKVRQSKENQYTTNYMNKRNFMFSEVITWSHKLHLMMTIFVHKIYYT